MARLGQPSGAGPSQRWLVYLKRALGRRSQSERTRQRIDHLAKCLVTGGAGFMGAHVARALLERGHDVVVLDDLSGGFAANVPAEAKMIEGSITDESLIERTFAAERFDHVYHLAAYAAEGLSHFIKRFNYNNNVIGSVTLINAAVNHEISCFVFTSSIAVYGAGQVPMVESLRPEPEDSYGIAKFTVEQELEVSKEMFGLDYVIFRPHNVYGELQNIGDRYRNVLGIFMNQIMRGEPLSIFGDGEQTRAFSYVRDIVPAIAQAPEVPDARCEIFNIGADVPYTVNELASAVKNAMGVPDHPVRHHEARSEVKHAFSDHAKAEKVFGANVATPLEQGVRQMTQWVRERGPQTPSRYSNIEIERNLPPSWLEQTSADAAQAHPGATLGDTQ
jgi:UDP-glucose 4-epimerase